ncbi:hypothetical protein QBC38DRAFT_208233 [Podospora fimiseda]|uniref:Heterokaryon incompatibility domain-containing protein n=1 Tax=Podospora fimiseda TaxID=252190 RepID=A0AAN7BPC1_9PEZI|nr:hypothetical protein QBC38DRAFT_208233 [Podospora fimiseda]
MMGMIYQRSYLTIIAAAGDRPSYGLPAVSSRKKKSRPFVKLQPNVHVISPPDHCWDSYLERTFESLKWRTRGWTYQEGALSKRRLLFTDSHLYFECAAGKAQPPLRWPYLNWQDAAKLEYEGSMLFPPIFSPKNPSLEIKRCIEDFWPSFHQRQRCLGCVYRRVERI